MKRQQKGKQHYFPAALIGNFSYETGLPRRARRVFAARRTSPIILRSRAERYGVDAQNPRLYGDVYEDGFDLDSVWSISESSLSRMMLGLEQLERDEEISTAWFANVIAPFIAALLARSPELHFPELSSLRSQAKARPTHELRFATFAQIADVLLTHRRWTVVRPGEGEDWITSDSGVLLLPGTDGLGLFIPLSPDVAVAIWNGRPTYSFQDDTVRVKSYTWSKQDTRAVNDAFALAAPLDVYASKQRQAERVLELWSGTTSLDLMECGLSPDLLTRLPHSYNAWFATVNDFTDERTAHSRFLAVQHEFACNCNEVAARLPETQRSEYIAGMKSMLSIGTASLLITPRSAPGKVAYIVSNADKNRVLVAKRSGFREIPMPAGEVGFIDLNTPFS